MSTTQTVDLTRPEVTVGFAMVDQNRAPFPSTVTSTERGAMVNALVSVFGQRVYEHETDAAIQARFQGMARGGYRISVVLIEAVDVIKEAAAG